MAATTPIAQESEGMLMFLIASKEEEPDLAKAALQEVIRRHREYLYRCCKRMSESKIGFKLDLDAEELTKATFAKIWEKANTYKPLNEGSPSRHRWRTRGWLGRIANNLFVDRIRVSSERHLIDVEIENVPAPAPLTTGVSEREREVILDAWESLTEREQIVIHTTERFYKPGAKQQRLPNEISKKLAQSLGCTSDGVRQIRRRALSKMKNILRDKGFHNATYQENEDD